MKVISYHIDKKGRLLEIVREPGLMTVRLLSKEKDKSVMVTDISDAEEDVLTVEYGSDVLPIYANDT